MTDGLKLKKYRDKDWEFDQSGCRRFWKKLRKGLDSNDMGALGYGSFVMGLLFASWFPRFTKKFKALFVLVGLLLMLPTALKAAVAFCEAFSHRR